MISTPFYGNNLCNLLSNKIIEEFKIIDSNHNTFIDVIDFNNFIILKGKTTINTPLNFSSVFVNYMNEIYDINRNYNVIDLIEYGTNKITSNTSFFKEINHHEIYNNLHRILDVNKQGFVDLKSDLKVIHTNKVDLISEYEDNQKFKSFLISEPTYFFSDKLFGSNLNLDKIYSIYFKYISYHLFESNTCKDISFNLKINDIESINNDNITLNISSKTNIVNIDWLKSLILDLFDFNPIEIKKHLSLDNYNFETEVLSDDKCWKKKDKISEIIIS